MDIETAKAYYTTRREALLQELFQVQAKLNSLATLSEDLFELNEVPEVA